MTDMDDRVIGLLASRVEQEDETREMLHVALTGMNESLAAIAEALRDCALALGVPPRRMVTAELPPLFGESTP